MRRAVFPIVCALVITAGGHGLAASPSPPLVVADVPTYRGDMARTGRMPGPAPSGTPVIRWRMQADAPLGVPVVSGGIAYVVDDDGTVYAVDLGTGSKLWTLALGAPSEGSPPLVTDGSLVVGDASGSLHALDLSTARRCGPGSLIGAIAGSPASAGRSIVVGTMGSSEYVLDDQSGSIQQQVTLPGRLPLDLAGRRHGVRAGWRDALSCVDVERIGPVADPAR